MVRERIKTIHHLREVSKYVDKNTLLLLDIDDTLIKSISKISDPNLMFRTRLYAGNFRKHNNKFMSYCNPQYLKIVADYNKMTTQWVKYKLEHPLTPKLLNQWYKQTSEIWGFTSRGLEISKDTRMMLEELDIKFSRTSKRKTSDQILFHNATGRSGSSHKHRMIFCGGYDKGVIMMLFYIALVFGHYFLPYKIVVVDDQKHNLESCLAAFNECKKLDNKLGQVLQATKFIGLHYERL